MASPHHLASAAGSDILARGGNALDAAIAANLVLGVVTPYLCGFGGDVFAQVWDGKSLHAYNGSGRAPAAATLEEVSETTDGPMPMRGPISVTVPGAVDGWFALLERFGSVAFSQLSTAALAWASDGFEVSPTAARIIAATSERTDPHSGWHEVYGKVTEGSVLVQPGLARTIEVLSAHGRDPFYRGPIAASIAAHQRARGGFLEPTDLAEHTGDWVQPVIGSYRGVEVAQLPPNTQGVTALQALAIADGLVADVEGADRDHVLIEAMKLALADRSHIGDPAGMWLDYQGLLTPERIQAHRARINRERVGVPRPSQALGGGTAAIVAADENGMIVSLIQSNYMGFGSGETVSGWGINLHNRGASFSLTPGHVNVVAPRKRPLHTLIPAMVLRDGVPWLAFATMGGDGQAQTHLQVLTRILVDGLSPQEAIDAPRWVVSPLDHAVVGERRFGADWFRDLRARGHDLTPVDDHDWITGHAQAIQVAPGGYVAGSDPRAEGAVLGL